MKALEDPETLVDNLLAEQRQLTAVEKFGQIHERHRVPLLEAHYRDLIPLSTPQPGEQYAFDVNLDRCSSCKACVSACHSLNGLDDGEAWREVGALLGERLVPEARGGNRVVPLQQTVTTTCHHCVEPACQAACPVLAYDKDPITGIVRHLSDQCIGCSYCVMKCPYEVPKYSAGRGIVRKCDMCHGRLAVGEAPACVQACPTEAIRIALISREEVKTRWRASQSGSDQGTWLPDAPGPQYTLPTTRYRSIKRDAVLLAADHFTLGPAPAHWPLALMLVLTQAGIGGMGISLLGHRGIWAGVWPEMALVSFALYLAGLGASAFHLGQPAKAWRVWLGWRTSWLSREAIALGAFALIGAISFAAIGVVWVTIVLGFVALIAQAMVYADTRREFWRFATTFPRFVGTAVALGLALKCWVAPNALTAVALALVTLIKLGVETATVKVASSEDDRWTQCRRTAALQQGRLRSILGARLVLALVGGALIPFSIAVRATPSSLGILACALCFAGELAERHLFFVSVSPDRMPGRP